MPIITRTVITGQVCRFACSLLNVIDRSMWQNTGKSLHTKNNRPVYSLFFKGKRIVA